MTDKSRISNAGPQSPANDNKSPADGKTPVTDPVMKARTDALILVLARLLGRQIAREEFERRMMRIANDNELPPSEASPDQEGVEDP
uniref:hypothetical protein n=1 Tax=Gluconobacter thailandicus TaxID=257438 RepID=UPI0012E7B337|nr:hypothetical protein [Gluconobacter thailandicus]